MLVLRREVAMANSVTDKPPSHAGNYSEMELQNQRLESDRNIPDPSMKGKINRLLWHGGSVGDAWFSAASNQVLIFSLMTKYDKDQ
ncbi:auxin transporter-like protein 3 [Physcomitrium patens]|uniref:auxin transporter-like protein 3 n=1 Tax=Physcomitrium patens TaxID=3218 RepID=UPI003CCD6E86